MSRKNRTLAGTSSWPQVQPQSMGLCDTTKGECKENPPEVQILPCWEHSGRGRWRRERPTVPWWSDLTYCKGENGQKLNNESSYKIWKKKRKFKTIILLPIECIFGVSNCYKWKNEMKKKPHNLHNFFSAITASFTVRTKHIRKQLLFIHFHFLNISKCAHAV